MQKTLNAIIFEEDGWYISQCIEIDVASQGNTDEEAFANLQQALTLHLAPPTATSAGRFASSVAEALQRLPAGITMRWELVDA